MSDAGMSEMDPGARVPPYTKFMFGMGQAAESVKNFGFGTLLLLYYNQVLGLSGTYSGIAISIALVADAISDPAVGSWSDGIRSRLGRRHPFMYASILPMGATFYFLFMPPEGLSGFPLFLWFTAFCILTRTALTFFHVPYLSLGAELTQNYEERTRLVVIRMAFGLIASLIVISIAWNYFFIRTPDIPSPQLTREPYFKYALVSAFVMMGMMLVSTWGTTSSIPHLAGARQAARPFSLSRVYADIYQALQNRAFRALFLGTLLFSIFTGVQGALAMHLKTFYWELDTTGIQYWQYGALIGGVVGLPLAPLLNRLIDKKWTVIVGCYGAAVAGTGPVLFKLAGWMSTDMDILVPLLVTLSFVGSLSFTQTGVSVPSMMGDIADEHELKTGTRQEGIYFGSFNFSSKCTHAAGSLLAGFALDLISFPVNSSPGNVPEDVLWNFGAIYGVVLLVLIFSTWVFWPYDLDRKRHTEVLQELQRRRLATRVQEESTAEVEVMPPGAEGQPT